MTLKQALKALDDVLYAEYGDKGKRWTGIGDEKVKQVLSVGLVPDPGRQLITPLYDFMKILDLFKARYKPVV